MPSPGTTAFIAMLWLAALLLLPWIGTKVADFLEKHQ